MAPPPTVFDIDSPSMTEAMASPSASLCNLILREAILRGARALRLIPSTPPSDKPSLGILLQVQVDAEWKDALHLPTQIFPQLVARLRTMADLAAATATGDGYLHVRIEGRELTLPVQIVPGEAGDQVFVTVPSGTAA